MKIEQNKNSSAIFRVSSFILIFVLLFSICVFPVSAYTDTSLNGADFSDQPVPEWTGTGSPTRDYIIANGYKFFDSPGVLQGYILADDTLDLDKYVFASNYDSSTVYVTIGVDSNYTENGWLAWSNNPTVYQFGIYSAGNTPPYIGIRSNNIGNFVGNTHFLCPYFSSLSDGRNSLRDWIDNPSSGSPLFMRYDTDFHAIGNSYGVKNETAFLEALVFYRENGSTWPIVGSFTSGAGFEYSYSEINNILFCDSSVSVNNQTLFYNNNLPAVSGASEEIASYGSLAEAQAALVDALSNYYPAPGTANFSYSLPPGNAIVIELTAQTTQAQLIGSFNYYSSLFGSPWTGHNQRFGYSSEMPSASASFPLAGMNVIPWVKTGSTNVLGQSVTGVYQIPNVSINNGRYLVVFNPYWGDDIQPGSGTSALSNTYSLWENGSITVAVDHVANVKVIGLDSTVELDENNNRVVVTNGNGQYYDRDMSNQQSNTFVDQDGNISSPSAGGGSNSNSSTSFWSWLNGKIDDFMGLFNHGYDAIRTLVGEGSSFMSVVSSLYSWLPGSVLSVLTSALTLVIIIGVVKVFL